MLLGSTLLEVAIGIIFVYLLLSSICSALNEILEGWLKNRATDLERGIREMLIDPKSNKDTTGIVATLYNHPLINGLYKGTYERFANFRELSGLWRWLIRFFHRPKLPSYIPARNFALALMDAILPAIKPATPVTQPSPAPTPPPTPPTTPAQQPPPQTTPAPPAGAQTTTTSQTSSAPPAKTVFSGATDATPPDTPAPAVAPGGYDAFQALRDAISGSEIINNNTRQALLALVDAAGRDVSKVRENIETWFNSSMDRVSGWYKRRSQIIIFLMGLVITVGMNVDTVLIIKRLSTDKTLRDSLVATAEIYAKENATPTPTPAGGAAPTPSPATSATPAATPAAKPSPSATASPSPTTSPASSPSASSTPVKGATTTASPTPSPTPKPPEECVKDPNSAECKLAKNRQEIESLGLPIGWNGQWPGNHWKHPGGWWDQLRWHGLGWLLTALAVSLGAPFWFDLLNKFIVIRSTVKPHEKSPEEKSKE